MTDSKFADLIMQLERAKAKFDANKTETNFKRWDELAREYSKQLRIRQDAKAGQL
jgi:hypothetical protein